MSHDPPAHPDQSAKQPIPKIASRKQLVWALHRAAEIEHLLMCLYLSTAFSTKKANEPGITPAQSEQARRWEADILMVARQEMEHLALVNNLLIGMGERPYFSRPNLPMRHYLLHNPALSFVLEPLGLTSLGRYVMFEAPDDWDEQHDYGLDPALVRSYVQDDPCAGAAPLWSALEQAPAADAGGRSEPVPTIDSVQDLYTAIEQAVSNKHGNPELSNLFRGSGGREPYQDFPFNMQFNIFTFPVTDIRSARAALALILEQGEGLRAQPGFSSHFNRFASMFRQLRADDGRPRFDPAWNTICNPSLDNVTDPLAAELLKLFNHGYTTMMYMLTSFYTFFSPTSNDVSIHQISTALQSTAFAPMMTMFLRPIGEILCRLPAQAGQGAGGPADYAGPSWVIQPEDMALCPTDDPAFFVERLDHLVGQLRFCVQHSSGYDAWVPQRLLFIHDTFERVANNFRRATQQ